MFEYFTDKAIKAIMLAQEEARRGGHNLVGSEQILLGIIGEGTSFAATTLSKFNINLESTRRTIESFIGRGPGFSPAEIPFTPQVKQIFEQSFQEARQLGDKYIAPEHILLAIISNQKNVATKSLILQAVDPLKLRKELINKSGERVAEKVGARQEQFTFGSQTNRKTSLEDFSINLTELAKKGKLDPLIGREKEVERTIQILGRRTKNNPVLVGPPGVGKTAISEGLAQRIVSGEVPELLLEKQVISLDLTLLVSGTKFRGEFEERLKNIVKQVKEAGNIILVIDEIHTIIGAGGLGGGLDASNMLKPALARGELQCLGATTLDEYRKYIEKDAALERRFQKINVGEPSVDETIEILQGLRPTYEKFHQVKFTDKALIAAAQLSHRYISDRFLPDKAIDLIDESGSRTHLMHSIQSKQNQEEGTESPVINPESLVPIVDEEEIATIVGNWKGIPVNKVTESESELLIHLEDTLHERVIGQDEAVKAVSRAVRRARVGLKDPTRPIASFIFSGPTGVGKTELAKALATYMFGSVDAMIRLDMSEYMEPHTVSKLIGSAPGFIGYEEGGQLTEAVRRKPYSIILFDEIEKAHPDVFNVLLQLLDDGRLTDSSGRHVDFKNTIIIMTSNIGSKVIEKGGANLGFEWADNLPEHQYQRIQSAVNDELKRYYRPEFINRIDEIIVFRQLTQPEVKEIADILLKEFATNLGKQRNITLDVSSEFKDFVVAEGYNPSYGARPLRRALMRHLEDNLAEAILSGKVEDGSQVTLDLDDDGKVQVISSSELVMEPISLTKE